MRAFITGKSSDYSLSLSWKSFRVTNEQLHLRVPKSGTCTSYNSVKGHTTFYKLLLFVEEREDETVCRVTHTGVHKAYNAVQCDRVQWLQ